LRQFIKNFIFLTAFLPTVLFCQIFHTDPYRINFTYLNIEQSSQDIKETKIKKISSLDYELKKDGTKKKKPKLNYIVEFDKFGNPTHYQYKFILPCWWLPTLKQKLKLEKEISTTCDYFFQYDSLQNLTHVKEYIVESISASHSENDVYFFYDKMNNLINQTISNKTIYKPGFKYRGVSYDNDTSVIKYTFNYNNKNNVTTVSQWRNDFEPWQNSKQINTLVFNCSFDSIFSFKDLPKGVKVDSLGRIVEETFYSIHGKPLGGGACITPDSPNDIIKKYFYDNDGRLYKAEMYSRRGDFLNRIFWKYDNNGLLLSRQFENALQITCYEYERY